MTHSKSEERAALEESREQHPHSTSNLRGGRFAPRLLYFWFYLTCRLQATAPKQSLPPNFLALQGAGVMFALPSLLFVVTIGNFFPFFHLLENGRLFSFSGTHNLFIYVLFFLVLVCCFGSVILLFYGRYKRIMLEFSSYDKEYSKDKSILIPYLFLLCPWSIFIMWMCYFSIKMYWTRFQNALWYGSLAIFVFYLLSEVIFRLWWKSRRKVQHQI